MRTEMDVLVMEDYILYKEEQPPWKEKEDWRDCLELD
jgi:carbamoyltransferase